VRPLDSIDMSDGLIVPFERSEMTFLPIIRRDGIELVISYREARYGAARVAVVLDVLGEALVELVAAREGQKPA
jgi:hypothetical protein